MPLSSELELGQPSRAAFNPDVINPSGNPDAVAAQVTRSQWQHFLDFYRPIEDEVLKKAMQTDFTAEGDTAGRTAAAGVESSKGSLARSLSRAGTSLTAEEQSAVSRRQASSLTKAVGQAENTTRRGLSESRGSLLAGIVGIGRGVANTATSGLQSVADMAAQREAEHQRQKASASASNMAAAGTAAALLISAI